MSYLFCFKLEQLFYYNTTHTNFYSKMFYRAGEKEYNCMEHVTNCEKSTVYPYDVSNT